MVETRTNLRLRSTKAYNYLRYFISLENNTDYNWTYKYVVWVSSKLLLATMSGEKGREPRRLYVLALSTDRKKRYQWHI